MNTVDATTAHGAATTIDVAASAGAGPPLDVLIVGAGLSGIGAAARLQQRCPHKRVAIVEARDAIGGTWDLFRYPGVRSDSDMYTLAYPFRPWTHAKAIADGGSILRYIHDTADDAGIGGLIRFGHAVRGADWSSANACWTVTLQRRDGSMTTLHARFLYLCCGYYRYDEAHRPEFAGEAAFGGKVVHPQFWPPGLDVAGKRVVVVGSGATAVTLAPALAELGAQVTMLQRSPSYVVTQPSEDRLAQWLLRHAPQGLAYGFVRWKHALLNLLLFQFARRLPAQATRQIIELARRQVGPGFDPADFTPRYKPWDQRVCVAADGDLFRQMRDGRVSVRTDAVERFTPHGLRLASGAELPADIVVLATGLKLNVLGDIALRIDGRPLQPAQAMAYKGMMLGDVPNLALAFGYTNASWTLKADLTAGWVCRLLRYMDHHGHAVAMPRSDPGVAPRPFLDFTSGYVQRAIDTLPKQGSHAPWRVHQNYLLDLLVIRFGRLADGVLRFGGRAETGAA